jgi:hypothetical protein
MRNALFTASALLAVGCSNPTATGTLTDGISGEPIAEMRLIAEATGQASLTCATFEATTDAQGAFKFGELCSGTPYALKPANENLWLADGNEIPDGGVEGLALKAWMAPSGSGLYRLKDGELQSIKTSADIKKEPIWNSDSEFAMYPETLPKNPVRIGPDDYLVLIGEGTVDGMQYHPLIPSTDRKFGSSKTTIISMKPWSYIGVEFTSDTEFERKTASLDESAVTKKSTDERTAAWVKGTALPAGRYAVHAEKDRRTTVLDFGAAQE